MACETNFVVLNGMEYSTPSGNAFFNSSILSLTCFATSSAFAPGQVAATAPMDAIARIAYGDLTSAVLALIAAVWLRYRWPAGIRVAWIVNVVMSVDWIYASFLAASTHLVTYSLGGNWYIINYYVPLIGVAHIAIFVRLMQDPTPRGLGTQSLPGGTRI